jgi:hypothetical protein
MTRRVVAIVAVLGLAAGLSACADGDPAAPAATTVAAPPTSAGQPTVQAVIDLGGQEAYGLAVDDTAVWAVA